MNLQKFDYMEFPARTFPYYVDLVNVFQGLHISFFYKLKIADTQILGKILWL